MTELNKISIASALDGLKNKTFSSTELLNAHLKAQEKHKNLNAFITETVDLAIEEAKESDQRYRDGIAKPLDGIPVAIKDLFCTKNVKTTNASKILHNFVPTYESTVSGKLRGAGAIMIGKANMDDSAMGSANITSYFGNVINPWKATNNKEELVPGGSSGGSAAAVAAHISMCALGSDTGGSVRQPAAFCGVVGFKPSYGRCSRYGMMAFASSLDQAGTFARSVEDTAMVASAVMGHDAKDSTSSPEKLPDLKAAIGQSLKGLKVGLPKEYRSDMLDSEIDKLWSDAADMLRREGAEVIEMSLPNTMSGVSSYYVIAPAEASSNLARYDGVKFGFRKYEKGMTLDEMYEATRSEGFGHEVQRRVMIGTYVLSAGFYDAYFSKAQKVRRLIANDFKSAFEDVDVILAPVTPTPAFGFDSEIAKDPIKMYWNDVYTIPASMAGLPAISLPCKLNSQGLPIAMQLIANRFDEATLFRAASGLEKCFNFKKTPEGF
ncbi:MAG: Asp-tRNA(Asn)/Glu-tRNA(Gln) amidotransferase subunit GatA [Rickettsiales bacterium]